MGYFSDLVIQIEEAYAHGATEQQIADAFGITVTEVRSVLEMMSECDRDPVEQDLS